VEAPGQGHLACRFRCRLSSSSVPATWVDWSSLQFADSDRRTVVSALAALTKHTPTKPTSTVPLQALLAIRALAGAGCWPHHPPDTCIAFKFIAIVFPHLPRHVAILVNLTWRNCSMRIWWCSGTTMLPVHVLLFASFLIPESHLLSCCGLCLLATVWEDFFLIHFKRALLFLFFSNYFKQTLLFLFFLDLHQTHPILGLWPPIFFDQYSCPDSNKLSHTTTVGPSCKVDSKLQRIRRYVPKDSFLIYNCVPRKLKRHSSSNQMPTFAIFLTL